MVTVNKHDTIMTTFSEIEVGEWFIYPRNTSELLVRISNRSCITPNDNIFNCVTIAGDWYDLDEGDLVLPVDLVVDAYPKGAKPE